MYMKTLLATCLFHAAAPPAATNDASYSAFLAELQAVRAEMVELRQDNVALRQASESLKKGQDDLLEVPEQPWQGREAS